MQPLFQNWGIDLAEVCMVPEVTTLEIGETRMRADQPGLDWTACQEHGCGGTVVGACTGIFFHAPSKLTKGHQQYTVIVIVSCYIVDECRDGITQLPEQPCMGGIHTTGARTISALETQVRPIT